MKLLDLRAPCALTRRHSSGKGRGSSRKGRRYLLCPEGMVRVLGNHDGDVCEAARLRARRGEVCEHGREVGVVGAVHDENRHLREVRRGRRERARRRGRKPPGHARHAAEGVRRGGRRRERESAALPKPREEDARGRRPALDDAVDLRPPARARAHAATLQKRRYGGGGASGAQQLCREKTLNRWMLPALKSSRGTRVGGSPISTG